MTIELPPWARLMQMLTGSWVSQAVGAAARLGIADQLAAGPRSADEIAGAVGAHAPSLYRLMRALAGIGVLTQPEPGKFGLSPVGECLRAGVPGTLHDMAITQTDHLHWASWERLTDAVRSGRSQARAALGMETWEYFGRHPEHAARFSAAMGNVSNLVLPAIVVGYDFSRATRIVDVAGAHGVLLAEILQRNPAARGVLFDLPHVVEGAPAVLARYQVADRVEVVAGDFFKEVPGGADLYLLKHIVHDWNDERAVAILKSCRAAMKAGSKLLVIELMLPPDGEPSPSPLSDLNMLVMVDGKERTEAEFATLLSAARLAIDRVVPTMSMFRIIEASPA
jgi:SAM-dependent methyltransferase